MPASARHCASAMHMRVGGLAWRSSGRRPARSGGLACACCWLNMHVHCQCLQDMAVCEQYVMGMLTNVDTGLALDRIHNMLKMFMVDPPYNRSQVAPLISRQQGLTCWKSVLLGNAAAPVCMGIYCGCVC